MGFAELLRQQLAAARDAAEAADLIGDLELAAMWRARVADLQRYARDLASGAAPAC